MIDQADLFQPPAAKTVVGIDRASKPSYSATVLASREGIIAQIPEGPRERAAFVRHHVAEIMKKGKTSAAYRSRGKKLLERCEAIGDTGAGDQARVEYEMAARSDALIELHIAALISRTSVL